MTTAVHEKTGIVHEKTGIVHEKAAIVQPTDKPIPPLVSVVVLTHNRKAALQRCIGSILVNSGRFFYEVIIVNNGSTDGTQEWLDTLKHPIYPIHRDENEFVCARNYGILAARGRFIAQVDDDVVVHPGWLDTLLTPMLHDDSIGATGQHGFYQDATWATLIDDRRRPSPGQFCDLVMGFCWAWRHDVRAPLTYDTAFNPFWHEESDLQMQLRSAGYRIECVPEVATHNSLHDWDATHADRGPVAKSQAEKNFYLLRDKWKDRKVGYEGPLVGL